MHGIRVKKFSFPGQRYSQHLAVNQKGAQIPGAKIMFKER